MKRRKIIKKLKENGWKQSVNDKSVWCYGRASITFFQTKEKRDCIMSPEGSLGAIDNVRMVSLTPYRILIQWNSYEEWYIMY